MRCPHCGTENPQDAGFCFRCGAPFGAAVPAGSDALAGRLQRLIPQEYAEKLRATRGQLGHERRLVTILFCDVKGSTAMAEGLDPEEVLEIMEGAFELLIAPVYRHEGTLARLMGDAVLAFFGAPLAHEDDPERAVRAGLEIIAGAQALAEKLERELGIGGFNVRVGIHTGQVVVGEVGSDLRAEYTAVGDAVNLAARMEQNAPPGGVLITQATYRHVRGVFDVQAQPLLQVKGRAEPVQAYLVERAKPRAWRMPSRGVEGIETRMVGREAELLALQVAFREVVDGHEARVVTVVGEPGVGKSRLLDEFTAWLELEPERVWYLRGRATAEARAVAYSLWRDLFAYRFDILETDTSAQALAKFRAGMAGVLEAEQADLVGHLVGFDFLCSPAVAGLLGSESFGRRASAYLVQYLRLLAGQGPVVMLLEDLHWADGSSLDLLAQAVERLRSSSLLVMSAARPEMWEQRPNWGEGQEAYGRLELRPLSKRASRALVLEILQKVRQVPEAVQQLVVDRAEGNPFYAEELVKMLIEDRAIVPGEEEWQVDLERLAQVRVPTTLTAVLQARLDALPREEKEVLQRASVVGREFWASLVAELSADVVPPDDIGRLLGALRGRELVQRRERSAFAGTEEYLFKHAMLRDVTYETVLLKVRRRCHTQVAAWLEGHAGERQAEYLGQMGGHYDLAGERGKAAAYLRQAGECAAARYANEEALAYFSRALALLPPADREQRWLALLGRDEVLGILGRTEQRMSDDSSLVALAGEMGDAARLAEAFYRQGFFLGVTGRYAEELAAYEAGLVAARRAGSRRTEALLLGLKIVCEVRSGDLEAAGVTVEAALAGARELGDEDTLARNLHNASVYFAECGDLARAAQLLEQQLEISRRSGDRGGEAVGLGSLGYIYVLLGLYRQGIDTLGRSLDLAQEIGRRGSAAYDALNLALAHLRVGAPGQALPLLDLWQPELLAMNDPFGFTCGETYRAMAWEQSGELGRALTGFSQAADRLLELGSSSYAYDALAGAARCLLRQGLAEQACSRVLAVHDYLAQHGGAGMELPILAIETCADIFEAAGDPAAAHSILRAGYRQLMARAEKISAPEWRRSFLEAVPEHARLAARWQRLQALGEPVN